MKTIGKPKSFAFELGDYQSTDRTLRHVDIWAGSERICAGDPVVYVDQFANDLAFDLRKDYSIARFSAYFSHLSPSEMAEFINATREPTSSVYDIEQDQIYHSFRFLDLGPTTDHLSAFLFRTTESAFLVYSFWRLGNQYRVCELDFVDLMSVCQQTINSLLDE